MDIVLLRTFLEVARQRHFGRAAERVFITQSAVSARIKQLEDTLGVQLFTRKRNNIQLTPAGQRLFKSAEEIVSNWEQVRSDISLVSEHAGAVMAFGFVYDLWPIVVREWVIDIRQQKAELVLQLRAFAASLLMEKLIAGDLDCAILFEPPSVPGLAVRELFAVPLVMVSTRHDRLADAVGDDYIHVDWGSAFSELNEVLLEEMPSPLLHMSSGALALDYLLNEGGSAYLAKPMVCDEIASGRLRIVADAPEFRRFVYFVYRLNHPNTAILTWLADECASWKGELDCGAASGGDEESGAEERT